MPNPILHTWKQAPILRLLVFFCIGIVSEWQNLLPVYCWYIFTAVGLAVLIALFFIDDFKKFHHSRFAGLAAALLFISIGAFYTHAKNIQHQPHWFGKTYVDKQYVVVTLQEELVEKTKSYKSVATVPYLIKDKAFQQSCGKIILYIQKDSATPPLHYGSQLIIHKSLQEIQNAGNPGGFDYKRYCLFEGVTHQVFLTPSEYEILNTENKKWLPRFLIDTRQWVLSTLQKNIRGKKELGLAEALLIGYKDDLDQTLVQSYTNTGVVHVIAISGLHLGIIYLLLLQLLRPLKKNRKTKWTVPLIIIACLWLFSLLAGAQPSILRSAVMFTSIVLGESFSKRTSIFNTLAFSAFILLLINPFWLWNVGFQLSYAAVGSIIIFQRSIYNWFYFPNKIVDFFWQLCSVTLAAQLLTTPLSIYHFHQFPTYFLLTNFVAVPLSGIILIGEILLCVFSFLPSIALLLGGVINEVIRLLNSFIEQVEKLDFSLWDGLQISLLQAGILLLLVSYIAYWLLEKSVSARNAGFFFLLLFVGLRSFSFIQADQQQKLIVYNVPQKTAIDFITGRKYSFLGDSSLLRDGFLRNFHLKPSRILYRIRPAEKAGTITQKNYFLFNKKKILVLNDSVKIQSDTATHTVDLAIIGGNPRLYIATLIQTLRIKEFVFDGSCPSWKIRYWKKDCDSLGIPYHDVKTQGAFVMNIR